MAIAYCLLFVDCSKYNFGTMPVLEIDGVFISQTMAILRYLGKELGTYNLPYKEIQN